MKKESREKIKNSYYEWFQKRYPNVPYPPIKSFSDKDANSLTKCILDFLKYNGHQAERVNSTGKYDPRIKKFVYPNTKRGTADIHATINTS